MAQIFLKNETLTVGANSKAESFGATGTTEKLVVAANAEVTVDQNIERIELSGASSAYTYSVAGNVVTVKLGTASVATYVVGNGDKTIAFADGSATLAFTKLDVVTLGGQAISATTSSALSGITLNKTDVSASAIVSTTVPYTIVPSTTSVTEGNAVTFTVTPTVVPVTAQTLNYLISGTASAADFSGIVGTVNIAAGATSTTFSVTPTNDGVVEGIEGFKVYLLDSNFDKVATSSSITINDSIPTVALTGATTVNEGSAITYTATLSSAAATSVSIPYTLSGTGITIADLGVTALTGNISVAAGATTGTLTLNVAADVTTEGPESLTVALGAPAAGATLGSTSSVVTSIADTSKGTNAVTVNSAGSFSATTADDTFNIAAGAYSATITNFDQAGADVLTFFTGAAISIVPDTNQTDGIQAFTAQDAASGATTTITLTGLTAAQDNNVFNATNSFISTFGAGSIA